MYISPYPRFYRQLILSPAIQDNGQTTVMPVPDLPIQTSDAGISAGCATDGNSSSCSPTTNLTKTSPMQAPKVCFVRPENNVSIVNGPPLDVGPASVPLLPLPPPRPTTPLSCIGSTAELVMAGQSPAIDGDDTKSKNSIVLQQTLKVIEVAAAAVTVTHEQHQIMSPLAHNKKMHSDRQSITNPMVNDNNALVGDPIASVISQPVNVVFKAISGQFQPGQPIRSISPQIYNRLTNINRRTENLSPTYDGTQQHQLWTPPRGPVDYNNVGGGGGGHCAPPPPIGYHMAPATQNWDNRQSMFGTPNRLPPQQLQPPSGGGVPSNGNYKWINSQPPPPPLPPPQSLQPTPPPPPHHHQHHQQPHHHFNVQQPQHMHHSHQLQQQHHHQHPPPHHIRPHAHHHPHQQQNNSPYRSPILNTFKHNQFLPRGGGGPGGHFPNLPYDRQPYK